MSERLLEITTVTIELAVPGRAKAAEIIIHPRAQTITAREYFPSGEERASETAPLADVIQQLLESRSARPAETKETQ